MRPGATRQEVQHVTERIQEFGFRVHSIEGEERVVIGVVGVGGDVEACLESLEATPGVEKAMRISAPYKFVSKEFRKERTVIRVGRAEIGGDEFVTMAGPCSVESEKQIMETAEAVAAAGAKGAARRRFQTAHFALRFSGDGRGRSEAAREGARSHRPRRHHRGDERPRCRPRRAVHGCDADRRAQHAELRAAESARPLRPPCAAEARSQLDDQGTADVSRIRRSPRQSAGDALRARYPHF